MTLLARLTGLPSPFVELACALGGLYWLATRRLRTRERCLEFGYAMSTLHAIFVGSYGLYLAYGSPRALDRCVGWRASDDWTFAHVMVAYMLVDVLFVAGWFSSWDIVAHHATSAAGIALAHQLGMGHGMCVRFAMTELSTVPLNVCWFLRQQRDRRRAEWARVHPGRTSETSLPFGSSSLPLGVMGVVMLLAYFFTRVYSIPEMALTCYPELWRYPLPFVRWFGLGASTYMMTMNVVWFYRLVMVTLAALGLAKSRG